MPRKSSTDDSSANVRPTVLAAAKQPAKKSVTAAVAKKTPPGSAKKVAAKKAPAKATTKKAAAKTPAKKAPAKVAAKKAPVKAPAKKAPTKAPAKPAAAKKAPVNKAPVKKAEVNPVAEPAKAPARAVAKAPVKKAAAPVSKVVRKLGPPDKFTLAQRDLLLAEREEHLNQAAEFKAEADSIAQEMEPGDADFGEEGGEGGTLSIDRERDLALSAQARAIVEDIDEALAKIDFGTYGQCESCGKPIVKDRLRAIPYARLCVACKTGGLSRR